MRFKDMCNEALIKAYGIGSANEATWRPGPNREMVVW